MDKKQILILSVIFAVLIAGLSLSSVLKKHSRTAGKDVYSSLAFSFDPGKVERIQIGCGLVQKPIELVKQDGSWKVSSLWNARADEEKINDLLEAVRDAKGELRSAGKSFFNDFGIGDENAISLRFAGAGDNSLLDLRIGIKKAGPGGFFVRKAGSDDVYFTDVAFDELFGIFTPMEEAKLSAGFWADLTLFSLQPEKVKKITVSRLKNGIVLTASGVERLEQKDAPPGGGWKLIGPQQARPVDSDKVLKAIVMLNSARAQDIADPSGKDYGLDQPVWRLAVTEEDTATVLEAGPKDPKDGVYFVKLRDFPEVYRLTEDVFDEFDMKNEGFLQEASKSESRGKEGPAS